MCSQEYISIECDVCSTEYSRYKRRTGGFEKCTDKPCKGLTKYVTAEQGGTCASCIMDEKRKEQNAKWGRSVAGEWRKGSAYGGY
jgi:hypothetical protein